MPLGQVKNVAKPVKGNFHSCFDIQLDKQRNIVFKMARSLTFISINICSECYKCYFSMSAIVLFANPTGCSYKMEVLLYQFYVELMQANLLEKGFSNIRACTVVKSIPLYMCLNMW